MKTLDNKKKQVRSHCLGNAGNMEEKFINKIIAQL